MLPQDIDVVFTQSLNAAPVRKGEWIDYQVYTEMDLINFDAARFFWIARSLSEIRHLKIPETGLDVTIEEENIQATVRRLTVISENCSTVGLPFSQIFIDSTVRKLSGAELTYRKLFEALAILQERLRDELQLRMFIAIPHARTEYYLSTEPLFGVTVEDSFPSAIQDVREAGRCLALDCTTACVFHLMRVLEKGLFALADQLRVTFKFPLELENWKPIIEAVERKIKDLEQNPKSQEKADGLKLYGGIAKEFRYFKDAWRNHVAHSRICYKDSEAMSVLLHVKEFMQELAESGIKEHSSVVP